MKSLKEKLQKQGGFTLIEMLIVVAIIAILVAVSIPLVGMATERAAHATDAANERAAKAEILLLYLNKEEISGGGEVAQGTVYYYDAVNGSLGIGAPTTKYGKHNGHGIDHTTGGQFLAIQLTASNEVKMQWTKDTLPSGTAPSNTGLCSAHEGVSHS